MLWSMQILLTLTIEQLSDNILCFYSRNSGDWRRVEGDD